MSTQTTDLWAVHVQGPDDILAAASKESAEEQAAAINRFYEEFQRRLTASEFDPRWHAVVIPWDGTAEEHARYLTELTADGGYMHEPSTPSTTTTRSA
jgi:hypothetical protein